jgi:hypothetical protein
MDLRSLNQFSPLYLSAVLTYPGAETGLVDDTLLWSSEKFTSSKLSLELVSKLCFGEYSGAAVSFRAGSVCCTSVVGSSFLEF